MDDEDVKKPVGHVVGMALDTMSVEELQHRIELLEAEIGRLKRAIEDRHKTRSAADSVFKF